VHFVVSVAAGKLDFRDVHMLSTEIDNLVQTVPNSKTDNGHCPMRTTDGVAVVRCNLCYQSALT
jgi:hypothetical protein